MKFIIFFITWVLSYSCTTKDEAKINDGTPKLLWKVKINGDPWIVPNFDDFIVVDSSVIVPYYENNLLGLAMLNMSDGAVSWKYHNGLDFHNKIKYSNIYVSYLKERRQLYLLNSNQRTVLDIKKNKILSYDPHVIVDNPDPRWIINDMIFAELNIPSYDAPVSNFVGSLHAFHLQDDGTFKQGDLIIPSEKYYPEYAYHYSPSYMAWKDNNGESFLSINYIAKDGKPKVLGDEKYTYSLYNLTQDKFVYQNIPSPFGGFIAKKNDILYGAGRYTSVNYVIAAIEAKTGKEIWRWDGPSDGENYSIGEIEMFNDKIYFIALFNLHCIDAHTGKRLWKVPIGGNFTGNIYYVNSVLYYTSLGYFEAFDATTGARLMDMPTPDEDGQYLFGIGVYYPPNSSQKPRLVVCDRKFVYCYEALR